MAAVQGYLAHKKPPPLGIYSKNLLNLLAEEDGGGEEEHACVEVSGFGFRASGFEFRVLGVSGFGFRVEKLRVDG